MGRSLTALYLFLGGCLHWELVEYQAAANEFGRSVDMIGLDTLSINYRPMKLDFVLERSMVESNRLNALSQSNRLPNDLEPRGIWRIPGGRLFGL